MLTAIYFDPHGADTGTHGSLNAEWVAVANTTASATVLSGWTLLDGSGHVYTVCILSFAMVRERDVVSPVGSHTGHKWRVPG